MSHLFAFSCTWANSDNPPEPMEGYVPGGYHPVTLGYHIASPTSTSDWRVVHKLGHGAYATVWLVQNCSTFGWAALRIGRADDRASGEKDVVEVLLGCEMMHTVAVIERFTIEGPNGVHPVTITEVVAPLSHTLTRLSNNIPGLKHLVRDIVSGLKELHARGIVHCDLHIGNIGVALPELSEEKHTCRDNDLIECFLQNPACTVVMPLDPTFDISHHPPYVVEACDMGLFHEEWRSLSDGAQDVVKFFDFGNAHLENKPCVSESIVPDICPPEWAVLHLLRPDQAKSTTLTSASDIWALGINILMIMSGVEHLSHARSWTGTVRETLRFAGIAPSCWTDLYPDLDLASSGLLAPADRAGEVWAKHRATVRPRCASDEDADALIDMLRRILVVDPDARPSASQVLQDPWFAPPSVE